MKKIILASTAILLVVGLVWAATLYQLPPATTISVNEWSLYKVLTSTCPNTIMIPTNTAGEWNNFLNNRPACVTAVNFCGGYQYAGFCWYSGAVGETCNQTCSTHNGYNDATRSISGSDGTNAHCNNILVGIRGILYGQTVSDVVSALDGSGCSSYIAIKTLVEVRERSTNITTNATATGGAIVSRICACNN